MLFLLKLACHCHFWGAWSRGNQWFLLKLIKSVQAFWISTLLRRMVAMKIVIRSTVHCRSVVASYPVELVVDEFWLRRKDSRTMTGSSDWLLRESLLSLKTISWTVRLILSQLPYSGLHFRFISSKIQGFHLYWPFFPEINRPKWLLVDFRPFLVIWLKCFLQIRKIQLP